MRDTERLRKVYEELAEIQIKSFPDQRFGQYMLNLLGWINSRKCDPFFPESDKFIEYAKEYANNNSPWFQGWELSVYKDGKKND